VIEKNDGFRRLKAAAISIAMFDATKSIAPLRLGCINSSSSYRHAI
jgi:hypothetical protein